METNLLSLKFFLLDYEPKKQLRILITCTGSFILYSTKCSAHWLHVVASSRWRKKLSIFEDFFVPIYSRLSDVCVCLCFSSGPAHMMNLNWRDNLFRMFVPSLSSSVRFVQPWPAIFVHGIKCILRNISATIIILKCCWSFQIVSINNSRPTETTTRRKSTSLPLQIAKQSNTIPSVPVPSKP